MQPWWVESLKDIGGVILGWALGLASALLIEWSKERKKVRATQEAIAAELREVAHRLLGVVYLTASKFGTLDRSLLEWMLPRIQQYAGPNPKDGMLAGVSGLLKRPDDELAKIAAHEQATAPDSLFQPPLEASYTHAAAAQAHDFEPDYALRVLDILSHIRMFNDVRENAVFYERLTFAAGLTDENHARAVTNADGALQQMAKRARIVVNKITALEAKHPFRGGSLGATE